MLPFLSSQSMSFCLRWNCPVCGRGEKEPAFRGSGCVCDCVSRQSRSLDAPVPGLLLCRRLQSCDVPASPGEPSSHSPSFSCSPYPTELPRQSAQAVLITALGSPSCGPQTSLCLRLSTVDSPGSSSCPASCLRAGATASGFIFSRMFQMAAPCACFRLQQLQTGNVSQAI